MIMKKLKDYKNLPKMMNDEKKKIIELKSQIDVLKKHVQVLKVGK